MTACAIWGTSSQALSATDGDVQLIDSPRAGGKYRISGSAAAELAALTIDQKLILTSWLCSQRSAGIETPHIDTPVQQLIASRSLTSVPRRLTLTLVHLSKRAPKIGQVLHIDARTQEKNTLEFLAHSESENPDELFTIFRMLGEIDLIIAQPYIGGGRYGVSLRGWEQLVALQKQQPDGAQAFVAMWFHEETRGVYEDGLAKAISDAGYKPLRIDKKHHLNKIDDEILAEIRRSRFVVADFTCEPKMVRGGVYYEAGFAMGLGIPVIWTCKKTSIDDLHFDTRQYSHLVWNDPLELRKLLSDRIGATIGDGPLKGGH